MLSKLEIFSILKNTYFENSEMTGDQLWLKLAEDVYLTMKIKAGKTEKGK